MCVQVDLRAHTADALLSEKIENCQRHLATATASKQLEALKMQLGQWIPQDELMQKLSPILEEKGLSVRSNQASLHARWEVLHVLRRLRPKFSKSKILRLNSA
eukprot:COSAG01_NODE_565_length_15436_cov_64.116581_4_plen_103_part_00